MDTKFLKQHKSNIIILWIRKFITSLFYFRGYRMLYPDRPWYMPKAHQFLERKISHLNRVFEYGSGDSSVWFAERVKEYIAVEHDQSWSTRTTNRLKEKNLTNSKVHSVPPDKNNSDFDWEKEWIHFATLQHVPRQPKFRQYMSTIDQYHDNYFDCIIIDGRERIGCLLHSIPKLAENGLIIYDDSAGYHHKEAFLL